MLIGDASHVYPPFGGQGIASGVRDAHSLFWRLAFLSRTTVSPAVQDKFLTGWGKEQRQACDHATKFTMTNGSITSQRNRVLAFLTQILARLLWCIPGLPLLMIRLAMGDSFQYEKFDSLFALRDREGGCKLPQIWIRKGDEKPVV
jgi:2-polyprenyl-6-methoxyphenol hydroxylase-like FAD-dependent oxidoreductase